MPKMNLSNHTWALAAMMNGSDKKNCQGLSEVTGYNWVCRRITATDGTKSTMYVVKKGPSPDAAREIVQTLNAHIYAGKAIFILSGDEGNEISISKTLLEEMRGNDEATIDDKKLISDLVSITTKDLLKKVQDSGRQPCKYFPQAGNP